MYRYVIDTTPEQGLYSIDKCGSHFRFDFTREDVAYPISDAQIKILFDNGLDLNKLFIHPTASVGAEILSSIIDSNVMPDYIFHDYLTEAEGKTDGTDPELMKIYRAISGVCDKIDTNDLQERIFAELIDKYDNDIINGYEKDFYWRQNNKIVIMEQIGDDSYSLIAHYSLIKADREFFIGNFKECWKLMETGGYVPVTREFWDCCQFPYYIRLVNRDVDITGTFVPDVPLYAKIPVECFDTDW